MASHNHHEQVKCKNDAMMVTVLKVV